jgi:hypothetical protein
LLVLLLQLRGGRFLFYKVTSLKNLDCLFFNDASDYFYLDHFDEIINQIEEKIESKLYKKIVLVGFSSGAFASAWVASLLKTKADIVCYSFSPHLDLNEKYSSCWLASSNKKRLIGKTFKVILERSENQKYFIFLPLLSGKDSIHVRNSFNLPIARSCIYYLNSFHDTTTYLRGKKYPKTILSLVNEQFDVLKANGNEIRMCLELANLYSSEYENKLYIHKIQILKPDFYQHETCYWIGRQLVRAGQMEKGLQYLKAAILNCESPENFRLVVAST